MTMHTTKEDGDSGELEVGISPGEGRQHQPQMVVATQGCPVQTCSPSGATFSDFSKEFPDSLV